MEAVIFVGIQGAGKSTFYKERFFDTHVRINLDMLKTRHREALLLRACLEGKTRFVVDNTNVTVEQRARYIPITREAGFAVIGYFFDVEPRDAARRNAERSGKGRVPNKAIYGTHQRLEPPSYDEGFDALYGVTIDTDGRFVVESVLLE
ncbi:MAG: AAA family ATPase [Nitrolancea sp.]